MGRIALSRPHRFHRADDGLERERRKRQSAIYLVANAAVIVLLLVVGFGVYLGEKASAADLRRTNDSILAQSQSETRQATAAGAESQRSWRYRDWDARAYRPELQFGDTQ